MRVAEEIAHSLEMLVREALPVRGPGSLHPRQWAILRHLAEAGPGAQPIGQIARDLGVTHAPASRAVATLAGAGLVCVVIDPGDRRVRYVQLTSAGTRVLEDDPIRRMSAAIEELDSSQRKRFGDILTSLHEQLKGPWRKKA